MLNDNVLKFNQRKVTLLNEGTEPKTYYTSPKGKFPSGVIPTNTVQVNMAVGMYQFHDLMSNHEHFQHTLEINDNVGSYDHGLLNF